MLIECALAHKHGIQRIGICIATRTMFAYLRNIHIVCKIFHYHEKLS